MRKPRLAIVSTYDDLCGIAGYTRFLTKQLEGHFDIEVIDLDQFLMRSRSTAVRALADSLILDFCARARDFDFVNIQLEYGIFGPNDTDIFRRLRWIVNAASAVSITFHTILPQGGLEFHTVLGPLKKFRLLAAVEAVTTYIGCALMRRKVYGLIREQAKKKPVNVIVHTRRDMRIMRYVNKLPSVYDHPLAFQREEDVAATRAQAVRSNIPVLRILPPDVKLIGVFGFLSEYKGFETVVRAMHLLPDNYHLLFFGGLHPNEIRKGEKLNPYLAKLLAEAHATGTVFDQFQKSNIQIVVGETPTNKSNLLVDHPKNIGRRLHFLGAQSDEDFARGIALCDHVVLPYLEVGQSSSGPMSLAVEMGARIIAARNHAFLQFSRYYPEVIEFFEIGNHVELAERILSPAAFPAERRSIQYNAGTNRDVYVSANTRV